MALFSNTSIYGTANVNSTLAVTAGIPSTSPTTGSVVVTGGAGVSGNVSATKVFSNNVDVLNFAQAASAQANTNSTTHTIIQGVDATQNTNTTATNTMTGSAYGQANTGTTLAQAAFTTSNTATGNISALNSAAVSGGSVLFNGTSQYLTFAPGSTVAFGTGDFTVEFWAYFTSAQNAQYLVDFRNSGQTTAPALLIRPGAQLCWYTGSAYGITDTSTTRFGTNAWHHVAYTRTGTTAYLFVDGVQVATGTDSTNYSTAPTTSYIGSYNALAAGGYMTGNLSNLRIVKGTALYTANFTPSTAPLTAIAGTQLLTCQSSSTITDASPNALTITNNGSATASAQTPFAATPAGTEATQNTNITATNTMATAAYAQANTGTTLAQAAFTTGNNAVSVVTTVTGYNVNSSSFIEMSGNTQNPTSSAGNYTIEFWFNLNADSGTAFMDYNGTYYRSPEVFHLGWMGGGGDDGFAITPTGWRLTIQNSAGQGSWSVNTGTWYHCAISRTGITNTIYLNGVSAGTIDINKTLFANPNAQYLTFGGNSDSYPDAINTFNGYISNFRYVAGTGLYPANFTVPSLPLTAISGTALLTFVNSPIVDLSTAAKTMRKVGGTIATTTFPGGGTAGVLSSAYNQANTATSLAQGAYNAANTGISGLNLINDTTSVVTSPASWKEISRAQGQNSYHTLAIRSDGALFAWGKNSNGQIGDGTTVNKSSPVQIGSSSWTKVAATALSSFGITTTGALFTWGESVTSSTPVQIGSSSWSMVAGGSDHALAITTTGALYGLGGNSFGQIGDGTTVDRSFISPVQIGSSSWSKIGAGDGFSLGITTTGALFAWGRNDNGQIGDGTTVNKSSPVKIGSSSWSMVAGGSTFSAGGHSLGITTTGALFAWGNNSFGQLGNSTTTSASTPVQIGSSSWNFVSADQGQSFAISTTGALYSWGTRGADGLGDGSTGRSSPVQIGSSSWTIIGGSAGSLAAVTTTGVLFGWGNGTDGAHGYSGYAGNQSTPVSLVPGMTTSTNVYNTGVNTSQNNRITAVNTFATSAYGQANTGTTLAQAAYNAANTIPAMITNAQGVDATQNTNITAMNTFATGAYGQANTGTTLAAAAFTAANNTLSVASAVPTFKTPISMGGTTAFMSSVAVNSSGLWVATGGDSGAPVYATSSNGSTWTAPTSMGGTGSMQDVAVNSSGLFVAVGADSTNAPIYATSTNGSTWTAPARMNGSSVYAYMESIAVNSSGLFVAIGKDSVGAPIYATSSNGTTWSTPARMNGSSVAAQMWAIAVNSSGLFVAVGVNGSSQPVYATASNGSNWTTPARMNGTSSGNATMFAVTVNSSGLWVATGLMISNNAGAYATSTDGTTWTTPAAMNASTGAAYMHGVVVNSFGTFISVGYSGALAPLYATSTNGTTWTTPALMNGSTARAIIWAVAISSSDKLVAVGDAMFAESISSSTGILSGAYTQANTGTTLAQAAFTAANTNVTSINTIKDVGTAGDAVLTVTNTGGATASSSTPFTGTAGSGSVSFGAGKLLTVPDSTDFTLGDTWTIEAWVYPTSAAGAQTICGRWFGGTSDNSGYLFYIQSGILKGGVWRTASGSFVDVASTTPIPLNTWTHVAMTMSGTNNVKRFFINGVFQTNNTYGTGNAITATNGLAFGIGGNSDGGGNFIGNISNVRVIKGTQLYTTSFTPSTTPLTAITGTVLLACQSSSTIGAIAKGAGFNIGVNSTQNNSINAVNTFATSAYGQANTATAASVYNQGVDATQNTNITSVNTFANAAYASANTKLPLAGSYTGVSGPVGGSIKLSPTSGNYALSYPSTFGIAGSNYTIEFWIYRAAGGTGSSELARQGGSYTDAANGRWKLDLNNASGQLQFSFSYAPSVYRTNIDGYAINVGTIPAEQWTHVCITRSLDGSNNRGGIASWINGVTIYPMNFNELVTNNQQPYGSAELYFGKNLTSNVSISNFRMSNYSVYGNVGNFTVPTSPLTSSGSTYFLTGNSSSSITDAKAGLTFTNNGATAQAISPFSVNTLALTYPITGNLSISNNLQISGNLTATGAVTSLNAVSTEVSDSLVELARNNTTGDTSDIGFAAQSNDGTTTSYSGVIRDAATKEFYVYQGYTGAVTGNNVDSTDASFAKGTLNANQLKGSLIASSAIINGRELGAYTSTVYAQSNTGTTLAQATFNSANTDAAAITVIQGTNTTQNTNIGAVNTYAGSAYATSNTGASDITVIQGVNTKQNTDITSATTLAQAAFSYANTVLPVMNTSTTFTDVTLGTNDLLTSGNVTVTGLTTVDSFSSNAIRSAKYEVQMTSGTSYQVIEVRVVTDGNNAWLTQYGDIRTGDTLGTISGSMASGIFSLTVNPVNSGTIVRFYRSALKV